MSISMRTEIGAHSRSPTFDDLSPKLKHEGAASAGVRGPRRRGRVSHPRQEPRRGSTHTEAGARRGARRQLPVELRDRQRHLRRGAGPDQERRLGERGSGGSGRRQVDRTRRHSGAVQLHRRREWIPAAGRQPADAASSAGRDSPSPRIHRGSPTTTREALNDNTTAETRP